MYIKQINKIEGANFAPSFVPKRKFWIGAAIGALGSIVSSELSRLNTEESEKFSRQMTREQIAANRENWMMQNAYNSPNAMVQRGTQAGFNALQSLGQTPAGAVAPATPVNARQENESGRFMNQMFSQISKFVNELPFLNAEKKKNLADAEKSKAEARSIEASSIFSERLNRINAESDEYLSSIPLYRNRLTGEVGNFSPPSEPAEGSPMEDYNEWYLKNEEFNKTYENLNPNGITYSALFNALQQNIDLLDKFRNFDTRITAYDAERLQNGLRQLVTQKQINDDDEISALAFGDKYKLAELISSAREHLANVRKLGKETEYLSFLEKTEQTRWAVHDAQARLYNATSAVEEYEHEFQIATDPTRRAELWNNLLRARTERQIAEQDLKGAKLAYERQYNSSPEGITDFDKDLGFGKRALYFFEWTTTNAGNILNGSVGYHMANSHFSGNVSSTNNNTSTNYNHSWNHNNDRPQQHVHKAMKAKKLIK